MTASTAGVAMKVRHPISGAVLLQDKNGDEEQKPVTLTLRGVDAPEFQNERKSIMQRRLNASVGKGKVKVSADEIENDALDLLIKCTVEWDGIIYQEKSLQCNPANVRMIYTQLPWLREQADAFTEDRANFLGN